MSAPLPGRTLADLDGDVLAHCARHLCARDVASLAMACRPLHAAAYCDAVWYRLYREQWPFQQVPRGALGIRELYIRRHTEVHQMKFDDPLSSIYYLDPTELAPSHLMLDRNDVWFSQGPVAKRLRLGCLDMELMETYKSHSARITCMRLFPLIDTSLFRSDTCTNEKALVTSSTDRTVRLCWKVRVWDTMSPPSNVSSSCVGATYLNSSGPPVAMKCYQSLCYIDAGSEVIAIDLRSMKKASVLALRNQRILSCEMLPSEWLICTGIKDKALLWDIRKSQELANTVAELHSDGPVSLLHLDPYKVVTGAPWDGEVHVWETRTGHLANTVSCNNPVKSAGRSTLSAMAVDGCRIITTGSCTEGSLLHYQDFLRSSVPVALPGEEVSKFWGPQEYDDEDSEDDH